MKKIFVAYPFELDSTGRYRSTLRELEKCFDVEFVFGEEKLTTKHILEKVAELMSQCDWLLFDVSQGNANVMLELGLVLAQREDQILIAFNRGGGLFEVPSDIRGRDRLEYRSVDELRRRLHERLFELCPKGIVMGGEPAVIRWNPRGVPHATILRHAVVFDEFRVHVIHAGNVGRRRALLVDVSCRIVSHGWRAPSYADAPWINVRFLGDDHAPIAVEVLGEGRTSTEGGFSNWLVADFGDGTDYRSQSLRILLPPEREIEAVGIQSSRGYALRSPWYRNAWPGVWLGLLGLLWSRIRRAVGAA